MPEYRITWEIDISAESPYAAARKALCIQRNPESIATCFEVEERAHRYFVGLDDWPLRSSRKWWSIYDALTGDKVNLTGKTGGWRIGSEAKSAKLAAKLNAAPLAPKVQVDLSE